MIRRRFREAYLRHRAKGVHPTYAPRCAATELGHPIPLFREWSAFAASQLEDVAYWRALAARRSTLPDRRRVLVKLAKDALRCLHMVRSAATEPAPKPVWLRPRTSAWIDDHTYRCTECNRVRNVEADGRPATYGDGSLSCPECVETREERCAAAKIS